MLDWDNDPELKAIRDEFIASLAERRDQIAGAAASLKGAASASRADLDTVQGVAHKVAGTAASYGFPSLTRAGEVIDDYLDLFLADGAPAGKVPDAAFVSELAAMLARFLDEALKSRKDDPGLLARPEFARLISAAESALSGART